MADRSFAPSMVDLAAIPALVNYDTAVDWPARLEREGPLLRSALEASANDRILDLGSGTGEHAAFLAAGGFRVVGIEGVEERWRVAKEAAPAGVEHLLGDLGAVEAIVRGQFGGALCLGNTLPALLGAEALSRTMIGLRRRLLPGSPFVLQVLNYQRIFSRGERQLPLRFRADGAGELVFLRLHDPSDDPTIGVTDIVLRHEPRGQPMVKLLHSRASFVEGWRADQLVTVLEVAQFRAIELFGGFDGQPFDPERSAELVIIAR